jgi:hypothetical protein
LDNAGNPRASDETSPVLEVGPVAPAPPPPANVCAAAQLDGSVLLTWGRPDDTDATIAFYRVYRDGKTYDDRYATWESAMDSVVFVDGNPGSSAGEYWVTAVSDGFAESAPVKADWSPCP